jgi:hypothetical protein
LCAGVGGALLAGGEENLKGEARNGVGGGVKWAWMGVLWGFKVSTVVVGKCELRK